MTDPSPARRYTGIFFRSRLVRFGSKAGLILVAGLFAIGVAYRFSQLWLVPEIVIAVPATEPPYKEIFTGLARIADPTALKVRVNVLPDLAATTQALDRNEADFAVVRTDVALPRNGLTVAQLRDDPMVVISFDAKADADKRKGLLSKRKRPDLEKGEKKELDAPEEDILVNKRIALVNTDEADVAALASILTANGTPNSHETVAYTAGAIRSAVVSDEIDAVAVVARSKHLRSLLASLSDFRPKVSPIVAPTPGTEAPLVSEITLRSRSLGPGLPAEDISTAALSWRLVGHRGVERATVTALLQSMFTSRIGLAQISDLAWSITGVADDDATFAKLPNHRGALDYYNREQQTFMDLYGDWLWIGLFAAGGLSSGLAWLVQLLSRRRKQLVESILDRLLEILSEARRADSVHSLDELTVEIDGLVTHAVRQARWRATDAISTTALTLAIDSSRSAIADQRERLLRSSTGFGRA